MCRFINLYVCNSLLNTLTIHTVGSVKAIGITEPVSTNVVFRSRTETCNWLLRPVVLSCRRLPTFDSHQVGGVDRYIYHATYLPTSGNSRIECYGVIQFPHAAAMQYPSVVGQSLGISLTDVAYTWERPCQSECAVSSHRMFYLTALTYDRPISLSSIQSSLGVVVA